MLSFLELELARLRLDDEARLSHNFSAILGMSESFPDVDVVLAVLGRGGGRIGFGCVASVIQRIFRVSVQDSRNLEMLA